MINDKIRPEHLARDAVVYIVNLRRIKLRTMSRASGVSTNSLNVGVSWDGVM